MSLWGSNIWGSGGSVSSVSNLEGFVDGMSIDRQSCTWDVVTGDIILDIEKIGGGDMVFPRSDGPDWILNCTTGDGDGGKARVIIPAGTSSIPKWSIAYVHFSEHEQKVILSASEILPTGAFAPIAISVVLDAATTDTHKPLVSQRVTEAVTFDGKGAISREREKIRLGANGLWEGVSPSLTITPNVAALDNINIKFTPGVIYQMHRQLFPEYDILTDGLWLMSDDRSVTRITDMNQITENFAGTTLVDGDMIIIDLIAAANYEPGHCKVFARSSMDIFTDASLASLAGRMGRELRYEREFHSVSDSICRVVLKYETVNSGTWTNVLGESIREWKTDVCDVKTEDWPASYPNNSNLPRAYVNKAGALRMRLNWASYTSEADYDFMKLYDISGNLFQNMHGNLGSNFQSVIIPGTQIGWQFTSDSSIKRAGGESISFDYEVENSTGQGEVILLG